MPKINRLSSKTTRSSKGGCCLFFDSSRSVDFNDLYPQISTVISVCVIDIDMKEKKEFIAF